MSQPHVRSLVHEASRRGISLWVENGQLHFKGPKGGIPEELREAFRSNKSALVGELSQPLFQRAELEPCSVKYPPFWKDFWDESQANPAIGHAMHFALKLTGEIRTDEIERALRRLISRYDILHSVIELKDDCPWLVRQSDQAANLEVVDLSTTELKDRDARMKEVVERTIHDPFEEGRVFRARIVKLCEREHAVVVLVHHFVIDGVSLGILNSEFVDCLQSEDLAVDRRAALPLQYSDYLIAMNEWLQGEGLEYRLAYWHKKMKDAPVVRLPLKREASADAAGKLDVLTVHIDGTQRDNLARASTLAEVPFTVALLAANFAAMAQMLRSTDLATILIHSGRTDPKLSALVGFTVNCFPVRVSVMPNMSYIDLMRMVQDEYVLARDYQVPWGLLMRSLRNAGVNCAAPIVNHMPVSRDKSMSERQTRSTIRIDSIPVSSMEQTNSVDWKTHEMHVMDSGAEMRAALKFMPSQYERGTFEEFAGRLLHCMECMANPASSVGQ